MTAKEKPEVQKSFVIDIDAWNMEEYEQYRELIRSDQFVAAGKELAKVVVEWPFESDPRDPASYGKLSFKKTKMVIFAVGQAIRNEFAEGE